MDVKTAFLNGDIDETIYMVQPENFELGNPKNLVCRLKKSIYGLKQVSRQWYRKFDKVISSYGFKRTLLISAYILSSVGASLLYWCSMWMTFC